MRWRYAVALVLVAIALGDAGLWPAPQKSIGLDGLNALIVTDTSEGAAVQNPVWLHPTVRDFVEQNVESFRVLDDSHDDFQFFDSAWQAAYEQAIVDSSGTRPWLLASGARSASQALPGTPSDLIKVLEACQ